MHAWPHGLHSHAAAPPRTSKDRLGGREASVLLWLTTWEARHPVARPNTREPGGKAGPLSTTPAGRQGVGRGAEGGVSLGGWGAHRPMMDQQEGEQALEAMSCG